MAPSLDGQVWQDLIANACRDEKCLHLMGLLSDGNVHSHIDHLEALLSEAKKCGVKTARVHALLDGRDVPSTSALTYIDRLEAFLTDLNRSGGVDFAIASGGGRMQITMDRYEADWDMVARGWQIHVGGQGRGFASSREAIETYRDEHAGVIDQDLPPFVIHREADRSARSETVTASSSLISAATGPLKSARPSRKQHSRLSNAPPFPRVQYAGMMQYDGDALIPSRYLVTPPGINRTMGEYLARTGVMQLAISETQKFGHVTYFFNGNRTGKFSEELEDYIEIPSDRVPFEERPWMKAAEITDKVVEAIRTNHHRFIRLNYANGDMVGHTGILPAVRIAVEAVDLCLERILRAIRETDGILIASADHGNSDDMFERHKKTGDVVIDDATGLPKTKTAHSLNPVPVYIYDPASSTPMRLSQEADLGISSLAATTLTLLGFQPPEDYTPSIVDIG
jgi:2,3-bisphosphoglycerate-independent phosphoglycerate mutase